MPFVPRDVVGVGIESEDGGHVRGVMPAAQARLQTLAQPAVVGAEQLLLRRGPQGLPPAPSETPSQ